MIGLFSIVGAEIWLCMYDTRVLSLHILANLRITWRAWIVVHDVTLLGKGSTLDLC